MAMLMDKTDARNKVMGNYQVSAESVCVRDRNVMANGLNIVMKHFLPIMVKLYKAAATEAHPFLNKPPDWNFGL